MAVMMSVATAAGGRHRRASGQSSVVGPLRIDLMDAVGLVVVTGGNVRTTLKAEHLDYLSLYHKQSHVLLPERNELMFAMFYQGNLIQLK